jgi:hypothetical protein
VKAKRPSQTADGSPPDAVAFAGQGNLSRKTIGYENKQLKPGVRRLREPSSRPSFERIKGPTDSSDEATEKEMTTYTQIGVGYARCSEPRWLLWISWLRMGQF